MYSECIRLLLKKIFRYTSQDYSSTLLDITIVIYQDVSKGITFFTNLSSKADFMYIFKDYDSTIIYITIIIYQGVSKVFVFLIDLYSKAYFLNKS